MASGHHAGEIEVLHERDGAAVAGVERRHVPERVRRIAAERVVRRELQAPVEIPDHGFREDEPRGVGRGESLARIAERLLGDLSLRAEAREGVVLVLEQHGVANERPAAVAVRIDVGDAGRPCVEGRHTHGPEQVIDERLAQGGRLVRQTSKARRQLAGGGLAAVRSDFDGVKAGERGLPGLRVVQIEFQLGKRALGVAAAGVSADGDLDAVDGHGTLGGVEVRQRAGHLETLVRFGAREEFLERRLKGQFERLRIPEELMVAARKCGGRQHSRKQDASGRHRRDSCETVARFSSHFVNLFPCFSGLPADRLGHLTARR